MTSPSALRYLGLLVVVFAAYFGCGWLGIKLAALPNSSLTLIWLPAGVALGALIVFAVRIWPAIWRGSFASNTPYLIRGDGAEAVIWGVVFGAGAATINTVVQGLLAHRLYRRLTPQGLHTRGDVIRFTFAVVLLPSAANISLLIPMYAVGGFLPIPLDSDVQAYMELFFSFSLADLHGYFLIAPLAIAWFARANAPERALPGPGTAAALIAAFALLMGAALFIFDGIIFLMVPLGVFIILQFGLRGVTAFNLALSLILTGATVRGVGPFAGVDAWTAFVDLLLFVFSVGFAGLFLAAQESEIHRARDSLEDTVRERTGELRAALAAKDTFLATVNHELRNPLHAILGLTKLIRGVDTPPEVTERTALIERAGDQLLTRINSIIDYVRFSGQPAATSPPAFELRRLLDDTCALIRPMADEAGVDLHLGVDPASPNYVRADADRIAQILHNLLSNAVKYGAGTPIALTVQPAAAGGDGEVPLVEFGVADGGPGVDVADQERIFEEFARLGTDRHDAGGAGLGLAICRSLADSLGGTLTLETPPNGGARFVFTVPLADAPAADATAPVPAPAATARRVNILLVEDDPLGRMVTADLLRRLDHRVLEAENAETALDILKRESVDALITDVGLPGMSGEDLIRRLRTEADGPWRALPAAALTASVFPDRHGAFQEAGFDAIFTKPIDMHAVAAFLGDSNPAPRAVATADDTALVNGDFVRGETTAIGDEKFADLITAYRNAVPPLLADLEAARAASDSNTAAAKLHRLAGMSSNLGLGQLQRYCADLERAVISDGVQALAVHPLQDLNARSLDALEAFLAAPE